jgi:hypothetical protein
VLQDHVSSAPAGQIATDVTVEDEGVGVPAGLEEKIFERVVRGREPGSGPIGTGLGLYILGRWNWWPSPLSRSGAADDPQINPADAAASGLCSGRRLTLRRLSHLGLLLTELAVDLDLHLL